MKPSRPDLVKGTAEWFRRCIDREQSNSMLRWIEKDGAICGVTARDVLRACLKYQKGMPNVQPRVTTVDEAILLRLLGKGLLPDDGIRDVLVYGSAYTVMKLHRKRPDLLPAEEVAKHIRGEAMVLIDLHFVKGRKNDEKLERFIRQLEDVPGFKEIVAVHAVHQL